MSLAQSFVLALKSLAASPDGRERAPRRKRRRRSEAVALVFTLRELFSDGGVGLVLDGVDARRTTPARGRCQEAPRSELLAHRTHPETNPTTTASPAKALPEGDREPLGGERHFRVARRRGALVALSGDEDEAVSLLRRALQWSPRKRGAARFALPLRRGERDRTVAVLQNAVNRVKEKKEKKKDKRRCFGVALCWECCM